MKAGDLVYHIDDARDYPKPPPGLIVAIDTSGKREEAVVYFTDRVFGEYHRIEELIKVEEYSGGYYDYR